MPEPSPSGLVTDAGPAGIYVEAADDIARTAGEVETVGRSRRSLNVGFWLATLWVLIVAFLAIFAAVLPFVDSPKAISADFKAPPSTEHWMGTDNIGRDIFARVVYGGRISLEIAGASLILGLLIGGFFGLVSGFYGKRTDRAVSTGTDILLAFPPLILTLAITSFLGVEHADKRGYFVVLALAILSIAPLTRIVRASTLVYSNREFVLAARGLGAKNRRILTREVFPNVIPSMVSFALDRARPAHRRGRRLGLPGSERASADADLGPHDLRGIEGPRHGLVDLAHAGPVHVPHDPRLQRPRRRALEALRHQGEPLVTGPVAATS